MRIAGIDEAGRGPVIGPLVVAGVACKKESEKALVEMGVKDSKMLRPSVREKLREQIEEVCECRVEIVSAGEIDRLREKMTMNELEEMVYGRILGELQPEVAYLDAVDVYEKRFGESVRKQSGLRGTVIHSKHRGDSIFPIVSAASIIAKTTRDREIRKIAEELGYDFGSGYPSDPKTKRFLREWVQRNRELPPYTRHSWQTAKKLMRERGMHKTRLEDFNRRKD